jgi:8-oxo-dGTP pyrophosphatase MutT (NUDIX family)
MVDVEETKVGVHVLLVTNEGKIILQQRDNNPDIVNPGLVSMFGGSARKSESMEECLRRELMEELELDTNLFEIEKLGVFYKTKKVDGMDYEANIFVIYNVKPEKLIIHEGKGFVCDYPEELLKLDKLARIARLVVQKYLDFVGNPIT